MFRLRQSTAITLRVGPFVDETDGFTAEAGLAIAQADIRLSKAGGAFAQSNNVAGAAHDENGWYAVPLDGTDTNTVGMLTLAIHEGGARPVHVEFIVSPGNVYDSLVPGSDWLNTNMKAISDDATAANNLEAYWDRVITGTAQGGDTAYITLAAAVVDSNDHLAGSLLLITGGTGAGQWRMIRYADPGNDRCYTNNDFDVNPAGDSTYMIFPHHNNVALWSIREGVAADVTNMLDFYDGTGYAGGTIKLEADVQEIDGNATRATELAAFTLALGTDDLPKISTDAQDLSGTLDINTKTITASAITAAAIATDAIAATKIAPNAIGASEIADGAIDTATFSVGAIDSDVLAATAATEIADTLLKRDWNSVSGEAARSVLNALRALRNKVVVDPAGLTISVKEEDDSTEAWAGTITSDASANPITSIDPA